jgi:hypothetical protein
MTPEQIQAALAHAIDVQMTEGRNLDQDELADKIAAAVMALVKPKPLIWTHEYNYLVSGSYSVVAHGDDGDGYELTGAKPYRKIYRTEALAQAAAQAHAYAAHYGQMVLADMIGVE